MNIIRSYFHPSSQTAERAQRLSRRTDVAVAKAEQVIRDLEERRRTIERLRAEAQVRKQ